MIGWLVLFCGGNNGKGLQGIGKGMTLSLQVMFGRKGGEEHRLGNNEHFC